MDRDFGAQRREAETATPKGNHVTRDLDLLAAQQCANEVNSFADRARRFVGLDAEFREARDAGTNAKPRASAGDFVDRRDRHRGKRRMTSKGIGDARSEPYPRSVCREQGEAGIDLAIE